MTKLQMNRDLRDYQEEMKETLRQVIQQNFIGGIQEAGRGELPFALENLLPCPIILAIFLESYEGQGDNFIGIVALHDFDIYAMEVSIRDDQGNLIERGEASRYPEDPELWEYLLTARIPAGTSVDVKVVATDCMGGVGVARDYKRIP